MTRAILLTVAALLVAVILLRPRRIEIVLSGAIAGKGMVTVETPAEKPAEARTESNRTRKALAWERRCDRCGAILKDAHAYSAHMRWQHPRPALAEQLFRKEG